MADLAVLVVGLGSPEGPDLLPDGRVAFVETFKCRVSAWSPERGLHEYAHVGGAPNACLVGLDGVYVTQNGTTAGPWRSPEPVTPSIQRVREDAAVEIIVSEASGEPLVGPNDLTFGRDGRLYFTDSGLFDADHPDEGAVCVVEPDGTATILERVGPTFPNGIVAEPDGSIVWNESFTRRVRRRRPDGTIELLATLPEDRIPDGMKLATDGSIYIAGVTAGGIDVLSPEGEPRGFIATGGTPLNCVFDGSALLVADFGDADVTGGDDLAPECGRLLRIATDVEGRPLLRGAIRA